MLVYHWRLLLAQKGFNVRIDTDADRVERIRNLKSYIADVSNVTIERIMARKVV